MTPSVLSLLTRRKPYVRLTTDREIVVRRPYRAQRPVYSGLQEARENVILDRPAALTTIHDDPWTAALTLFGGTR